MRRLTKARADGERGAVAVMFALLLVVLVGFIALAVDMGATYAKRQELQNGADAAALAAAQECATVGCGTAQARADEYSVANVRTQVDSVTSSVSYPADNVVQVDVTGDQEHWFLPVIPGAPNSSTVSATAYAVWGTPSSGTASLPLTFSWCDFDKMGGPSGDVATIYLTKSGEGCPVGPDGNAMPGGFGMVGEGACEVFIDVEDPWIPIDPGGNLPCTKAEMQALLGKVVLIPIYDACRRGGGGEDEYCPLAEVPGLGSSDREYHVYSFAAFRVDGFRFPGNESSPAPCKGSDRCIRGQFIEWVELEDAWEYNPEMPDLGTAVVTLIDPRDIP